MIYVLYVIHVVVALFLIMVVLLQQGKGADLSVFGGGATQAAFGARGAATLLHKLTVFGFVAFTLTTLGIGIIQSRQDDGSVMTGVAAEAVEEGAVDEAAAPAEAAPEPAPAEAEEPAATEPGSEEGASGETEPAATEEGGPSGG